MKKLIIIASLILLATPAIAHRNDVWRVKVNQMYRNGYGASSANITITLARSGARSSLLQTVCGVTGNNKKVCVEVDGGRMKQGESVHMTVEFPSTKYPVERIYVDN
ncbi:hypothetical protein [Syntrophotalea acetylenica]|uniref:CARDB domain-containing protein n=1 Tax=Syntrophotalea acetylenica TaxID=29542 RepID=A0A1L3GEF4_SYNAC|nr:hypothetical protein [Syntrophotalea acetylenica]APG24068.1 hypothetical protein A7E75_02770 [Syntrophotalea acetylenica]APG44650.1 hypothetical protein A6070_11395 [Syntrophotalea acetylenica]APG45450.1 hypothetical protein A6070_14820 [Syntrophotalea acetylenica]